MQLKLTTRTVLLFIIVTTSYSTIAQNGKAAVTEELEAEKIDLEASLSVFDQRSGNAQYWISLCADVPLNRKPMRVSYQQQTGHVFLIFQKIFLETSDTISQVFGFYPKNQFPLPFKRKVKSSVKDNSKREYDVAVRKEVTAAEFEAACDRALVLANMPYHLNKYNCYDFAVLVFNTVASEDSIPLTRIKFPLIFGKGGSPCCIYRDLGKLRENGSVWSTSIEFGAMIAPVSTTRRRQLASFN